MTTFKTFLRNSDSISNDHFEAFLRNMHHQRDWRGEVVRRYWEIIEYAWQIRGAEGVHDAVELCRQLNSSQLGEFTRQARAAVGYENGRSEEE